MDLSSHHYIKGIQKGVKQCSPHGFFQWRRKICGGTNDVFHGMDGSVPFHGYELYMTNLFWDVLGMLKT